MTSNIEYILDIDNAFKRVFFSFKACMDRFNDGCRPFLGLDGCHLRSKYLGMLLSAIALDANMVYFQLHLQWLSQS